MWEVMISGISPAFWSLVVTDNAAKVLVEGKTNVVDPAVVSGCGRLCNVDETLAQFEVTSVVEGMAKMVATRVAEAITEAMAIAEAKSVVEVVALVKDEFMAKGVAEVVATTLTQQMFLSRS